MHGGQPIPVLSRFDEYSSPKFRTAFYLAYFVSCVLIVFAAQGDLWLDEVWSLFIARAAGAPMQIITTYLHDNNHILNTLYLRFVGEQKPFWVYRLLAMLSGMGSVFLIGYLGRCWGPVERLAAVLLTATSYPLLLYFSEARGYAPAIFFALSSYAIWHRNYRDFSFFRLLAFWLTSILGILSHMSFAIVVAAFLFASVANTVKEGCSFGKILRSLAHLTPPLAFLAVFYVFFARRMVIGGGAQYTYWQVAGQISTLALGLPEKLASLAVALLTGIIVLGVYALYRDRDDQWPFYLAVLAIAPLLVVLVARPEYLYFRYFILCFPFLYLLIAHLLCRWYGSSKSNLRWLVAAGVLLLISVQAQRIFLLLRFGRGNYTAALTYILQNSSEEIVRVGSDHDFRNRMLVEFYGPRLTAPRTLRYVAQSLWRAEPPHWILTHSQEASRPEQTSFVVSGVGEYRFVEVYRFSGVSGWNWFLYERVQPNSGTAHTAPFDHYGEPYTPDRGLLSNQTP